MPTSRDPTPLTTLLARLYPTSQEAGRVASLAKIPPEFIDLQGSAIQVWSSILEQAKIRNRTDDLVEAARDEYPERSPDLLKSLESIELPSVQGSAYWNVPSRNDYFTGREDLLDALDQLLQNNRAAALTQTINGLGGIGKTQIAVEFCHRNRNQYPFGVFWADASSAETLSDSYRTFAVDLGWVALETLMEDAVKSWFSRVASLSGWLLILDNADDPEDIDHLVPSSASGHVLITTRHQNPGWGGSPLPVDVMPAEQAVDFLLNRSRRKAQEKKAAERLVRALGYLPLALEQAAAYLAQTRMIRIAEYLKRFDKQQIAFTEKAQSKRPLKGDYEKTVATTWEISFEKLPESAREALLALAFLNPENIPLELFHEGEHLGPAMAELDLSDRFVIQDEVIEPLSAYSFIEVHDEGQLISVHRLVQAVMLDRLSRDGRLEESFKRLVTALDELLTADPRSPSNWPAYERWIQHIQRTMIFWNLSEGPYQSWLWNRVAHFAWSAGRSKDARLLLTQQLEGFRRSLGDEHPDTLTLINNLAETLRVLGKAKAAKDLHQEALDVKRRVLGDEHPETLVSINNLALALLALGKMQAARDLHQEALDVRRRVLGDEHPETLSSLSNLAETLSAQGKTQAAKDLQLEALDVRRRVLGDEHPDTIISLNNLATSWRILGETQAAKDLQLEALDLSRRVLGDEHPDTISSIDNLALARLAQGETQAARDLHQEVLDMRRRLLGDEHPDTIISINNLASTLRALGEVEAARDLHQEALNIFRRVLGNEHPDTLISINNLASTLRALGETKVARDLHQEALNGRRRVLGDEHPDTLISINNLASTLRGLGEMKAARDLNQEALDVSRRMLGDEHPDTLISINNLASNLRALGDFKAARDLHQEALSGRRRVLGDEHPDTLVSMHNLLLTLRDTEGLETDPALIQELLQGVRKLPENVEIRQLAESTWAIDEGKSRPNEN